MGRSLREARPLSEAIGDVGGEIRFALLLKVLSDRWGSLAGRPLAERSAPLRWESGVLVVAVTSGSAAQGILFQRARILRAVRESLGLAIRDLKPQVASLPVRSPSRRSPVVRVSEPLREEEVALARHRLGGRIGDEDLERAFARMMAAYRRRFGTRTADPGTAPEEGP
jgi:hypothetical protein